MPHNPGDPVPEVEKPKPKKKISRTQAKEEWTPDKPLPKKEHEAFVQNLYGQDPPMNATVAMEVESE